MKNRQIGTFKEYLKEQRKQKLNESNVNIECDFWDACVAEVLKDLEEESGGFIDWNVLEDYIKTKFAILGRTWDEYIDNLYVLEIKDLIWAHHGKSFCNCTNNNAELHSKGVVVEALADEIFEKLCEKLGSESTSSTTKIKVSDIINSEPVSDEDDGEGYDFLESRNKVKKFKEYTKHLDEAAKKIERDNLDTCTAYCLDRIEKEAGSLDPDAVFQAAIKYATPQVKSRMVLLYVVPMVQDYLSNNALIVADVDDSAASKGMVKQAIDDLSFKMADDVLYALYKLNGGKLMIR